MRRHREVLEAAGELEAKRREQDVRWMHAMVEDQFRQRFLLNEAVTAKVAELEQAIRAGSVPPSVAADEIATMVLGGR